MLAAVALVAGLCAGALALGTPIASAAPSAGPLCEGYAYSTTPYPLCIRAPYTTRGYQTPSVMNTLWWPGTGSAGTECTNYVAWVERSVYGVATPNYALGHATTWATVAQAHGVTVNQTPTVGSVAQWNNTDPGITSDGHVAIVEAVGPNDSYIVVSQDNWSTDSDAYDWALILNGVPNQGQVWPDNFIHFATTTVPATLSDTQPDRLIQSTGNLYWTEDQIQGLTSHAFVFRGSKENEPGQEQTLYEASLPVLFGTVDFEAITYANVGGTWYGYFVANYPRRSESQIMRVPLTGGAPTTVVSTTSAITAIYPPSAGNGNVYWSEANGSVALFPGPYGSVYQLQAPGAGVSVTSVSVAPNYVLWGECRAEPAPPASAQFEDCMVDGYENGSVVSVATDGPPVDVQGDGGAWYWGDAQLEKFTL